MIPFLPSDRLSPFPDVDEALDEPGADGLLCAGGDLSPERLLMAYRNGIFPWYSEGEPILWWSPDPRALIFSDEIHISRSTQRTLKQQTFEIRQNTTFEAVVRGCAAPRAKENGTWILPEMQAAYAALHHQGHAHSIECWHNEQLVGGVYGVVVNRVFCGESMFSAMSNASKVALIHIAQSGLFDAIDCQIPNPHLESMGARCISRHDFIQLLNKNS